MKGIPRRRFLQTSSGLLGGFFLGTSFARARPLGPNDSLNIGVIGTANRAAANINGISKESVVSICDVDENFLDAISERYPKAKRFTDFRMMLEESRLDAVVVSTADHTHAPATMRALQAGLPVYCEKPLTHSVWEARQVAKAARKAKVATQMGTQIHAGANYRRVVELIQSGALGSITEAHCWVGKAWGGGDRPKGIQLEPANFNHDLWLGPAPDRPYHDFYHPSQWRRFWDFGGGTLGDMGCHHLDLPFWALELRHPTHVSAEGPAVNKETAPVKMRAHWKFPERSSSSGKKLGAVNLHWHDGGLLPPQMQGENPKVPKWGSGTLFVGEKGMLLCDYGRYLLLPEDRWVDFKAPEQTIPNSVGHYLEWLNAIRNGTPTTCNFNYSGALTEMVLLGNVAYRSGSAFDWDAQKLQASVPKAQSFIRREYRKEWEI
jgi:predicted dehydrogenase